jgi:hypothetical protein
MKNNKQKSSVKSKPLEEFEANKPKKKMVPNDSKVNVKSNKFWDELYDDEGDEIQKYLR